MTTCVLQGSKPWRYTGKEANMDRDDIKKLVAKWWDIYNDTSLDLKSANDVVEEEDQANAVPKLTILSSMPEPNISHVPAPSAA